MNSKNGLKQLRRKLWRPRWRSSTPFLHLTSQANRCDLTIRLFYALNFYIWFDRLRVWQIGGLDSIIARPVWPVSFVDLSNSDIWSSFFFIFNIFASLLALLWPGFRSVRVLAFLGLFFESAILNSDLGGWERMLVHVYDFVLIAFLLIFLPAKNEKKRMGAWKTTLLVVLAQITILSSFGASAIWRIRQTVFQLFHGMKLSIGTEAFDRYLTTYYTANRTVGASGAIGLVGKYLIVHKELSAPIMAIATAFELSFLFAICRPRLYRVYGIFIALFQLAVILTMNLPFSEHLLIGLLFLACSPLIDEASV
ncbi:MAG: hypothetical protein ACXVA9_07325 [Bdellovibrionales bacterium]